MGVLQSKEGIELRKSMDIMPFGYSGFKKSLFAKDILIEDYFPNVKKLTYVYDFGDWWEHTIEILGTIDNYTEDCPVVTKFKQASPPDDCGGIDGYYEFLEQYNSENIELMEWAEE